MRRPPTTPKAAIIWQSLFFPAMLVSVQFAYGQPPIPKFETIQPINLQTSTSSSTQPFRLQSVVPLSPNDRYRDQNYRMMQQAGMTVPGPTGTRQKNAADVNAVLNEEKAAEAAELNERRLSVFQNNLGQFLRLNPDSFSITKAVYLSESAYYDNPPLYKEFEQSIHQVAGIVGQILKRDGLSPKSNVAVNYAIQKIYSQQNQYFDSVTGRAYWVNRVHYDWDDFMGEHDWSKMFVTKVLQTGTGQCHSLPLFYLCLAEQLHAKAYLSLAPNHSFIQYFDNKGKRYNFEATNGNLVTQAWLMQSTYVNATALKNKTYLDTLSNRRLYAQCLADFLLSYLMKMRHYDDFSEEITRKILQIDSTNVTAMMEEANRAFTIFKYECQAAGNPSPSKYPEYPKLYAALKIWQDYDNMVTRTGFQEMPKQAYQEWLQSLQGEKQKELNKEEDERMRRLIMDQRKSGSRLDNKRN
jgi:hypothetical protein